MSLTCFLMLMKSVISNGVSLHYRETLGISHRRTQSVSQKSFVLRVQPLWQTHHPWEGLTLAAPLHNRLSSGRSGSSIPSSSQAYTLQPLEDVPYPAASYSSASSYPCPPYMTTPGDLAVVKMTPITSEEG